MHIKKAHKVPNFSSLNLLWFIFDWDENVKMKFLKLLCHYYYLYVLIFNIHRTKDKYLFSKYKIWRMMAACDLKKNFKSFLYYYLIHNNTFLSLITWKVWITTIMMTLWSIVTHERSFMVCNWRWHRHEPLRLKRQRKRSRYKENDKQKKKSSLTQISLESYVSQCTFILTICLQMQNFIMILVHWLWVSNSTEK